MILRALIVEDSADDEKLLLRHLNKEGFDLTSQRVWTAEGMQAALEGAAWDVVLADYTMPEFSGLSALALLQERGLDLPFIIISGAIGEDVAVEAMKAGAHDYMMKGNLPRLAPAIRRELREATIRRERRLAEEALRVAYAELETRVAERTAELAKANEELAAANEELIATNEELEETSAQLRESQEREIETLKELDRRKDEFLSIAAHELKTPLTTTLGFAQTLLRQYERKGEIEPERLSRSLHSIVSQSRKLALLVGQLLDLSRIEAGKLSIERERVEIVQIIREIVATTQAAEGQRITIHAPAPVELFVDPLRIEQVIINLVGNAIKYGGPGPVEISVEASDGTVDIVVRDYGQGIAPEHLPRIFERFYQAPNGRKRGLGLGLYVSHQIVELHGGQIWAENPAGGGVRFVVRLGTS